MTLYMGLMSGTSLDGVDGVLVDFATAQGPPIALRAHHHQPFEPSLRTMLLALNEPGDNELHHAELAANAIARAYAEVVQAVLRAGDASPRNVRALGAHGQTVRHRPREFDGTGYTVQLLNGALLAELTGIDVVANLRQRDVAAGGQGAPLAPGLHAALFAAPGETRAVLNLGGIANLTVLGAQGAVIGFDCGPASALLDGWCQRHRGAPYDDDGRWAASGRVIESLLEAMLAEPFFALAPPKSTGRDLFNLAWLDNHLLRQTHDAAPVDVQATLAALTIESIARDVRRHAARGRAIDRVRRWGPQLAPDAGLGSAAAQRARHHHRQPWATGRSGRGRCVRVVGTPVLRTSARQPGQRDRRPGPAPAWDAASRVSSRRKKAARRRPDRQCRR